MTNLISIKTALISVYDKAEIIPFAKFLFENGVKIISTGGTFKLLKENNVDVIEISDFTDFPEMMSGRLKTLHPKIHGGLLGRSEDAEVMKAHNIEKIDLVVVNLYPFEETVKDGGTFNEIIEKIDIGGPSMVRSSAKNFAYTTIITEVKDYTILQNELKENNFQTNLEFRKKCASKAFSLTGFYDSVISKWFEVQVGSENDLKSIPIRQKMKLRYGENPHQMANFYEIPLSLNGLSHAVQLQGKELSYNNIADADAAIEITSSFKEPAISIIKHANPCGIATAKTIEEAYVEALKCDSRSAFGGIVSINREVSKELAELLKTHFYEVIIAPKFSIEAKEILGKKTNLRLLESSGYKNETTKMVKQVTGGILMQDIDSIEIAEKDLELVAGNLNETSMEELIFSFKSVKFFKSNAIVITSGTKVVSFGCGQTSRVDSMEIACKKLALSGFDPAKCILSSDAFFPFTDNLELAKNYGIKTIIAPCGSVKDEEVKDYAKTNGINLIFAKTRHFRH
jgi:phosphoribosylaminoimidazolecarboxamide formyltransferase/IMP cyclohydrolase